MIWLMRRSLVLPIVVIAIFAVASTPAGANALTQITGTASSCTGFSYCVYKISNTQGSGSATTYGTTISFQLPGEAKQTIGQPYQTKTVGSSGNTYHISGSFVAVDANTGKIVKGMTNDYIVQTQHCSRTGCYYTYALQSGLISFTLTSQDGTETSVGCNPGTFSAGGHTTCTATVTDLASSTSFPTGSVKFSLSPFAYGTFTPTSCKLLHGTCSVTFTPNEEQVGIVGILASYSGDTAHYMSSGSTKVTITGS